MLFQIPISNSCFQPVIKSIKKKKKKKNPWLLRTDLNLKKKVCNVVPKFVSILYIYINKASN